MKLIRKQGKDIQKIVEQFKTENNLRDNEFAFDIVQEARKGLFGFLGARNAIVQFKMDNLREEIAEYLREFSIHSQVTIGKIDIRKDKRYVYVELYEVSDPGFLIGKDGTFLTNLQYLLNVTFVSRDVLNRPIILDVEEYKKRQKDTTVKKIKQLAQQAIKTKKSVTLEPMSPAQRRVVHQAIQNMDAIKTMTIGEGANKRIVLNPVKNGPEPKAPKSEGKTQKREPRPRKQTPRAPKAEKKSEEDNL